LVDFAERGLIRFEKTLLSRDRVATLANLDIFQQREQLRELAQHFVEQLDELAPQTVPWPDSRKLKLLYAERARNEAGELNPPELQVKLHECFALKEHPRICEGRLPVKLWLCAPDGKRLEATSDWPAFKANSYPKLKATLQRKYPGVGWL